MSIRKSANVSIKSFILGDQSSRWDDVYISNESVPMCDIDNKVIYSPVFGANIADEEDALVRGKQQHETLHALLTPRGKSPSWSALKGNIVNILEDLRIEKAGAMMNPVFGRDLARLNQTVIRSINHKICQAGGFPKPVDEALAAMHYMENNCPPAWRISERAQRYIDAAYGIMRGWRDIEDFDKPQGFDGIEAIADRMIDALQEAKEREISDKQDEQQSDDSDADSDKNQGQPKNHGLKNEGGNKNSEHDEPQDSPNDHQHDSQENDDGREDDVRDGQDDGLKDHDGGDADNNDGQDNANDSGEADSSDGSTGDDACDSDEANDSDNTCGSGDDEGDSGASGDDEGDDDSVDSDGGDTDGGSEDDAGGNQDSDADGGGQGNDGNGENGGDSDSLESAGSCDGNRSDDNQGSQPCKIDYGSDSDSKCDAQKQKPRPEDVRRELENDFGGEDLLNEELKRKMQEIFEKSHSITSNYKPFTAHDIVVQGRENKDKFDMARKSISAQLGQLAMYTENALKVLSKCRKFTNMEKGKLDNKKLPMIAKSLTTKLFYKETKGLDLNVAVTILIDESGSISWRYKNLMSLAIAFSEVFHKLGIKFEVLGYTTYDPDSNPSYDFNRRIGIKMIEHKNYGDNYQAVKYRLGSITSDHCNIDGESLMFAYNRIKMERVNRRIMFVLSDGQPNQSQYGSNTPLLRHLNDTIEFIRKNRTEVYAFGIGTTDPEEFYGKENFVYLPRIEDLGSKFFQRVREILTK